MGVGTILYGIGRDGRVRHRRATLGGVPEKGGEKAGGQAGRALHHLRLRPGGGGGRRQFAAHGAPFVVVDSDPDSIAGRRPTGSWRCRATPPPTRCCEAAGIARAKGLVAAVGSDAGNIFLTLVGPGAQPEAAHRRRAGSDDTVSKLVRAGADNVVSPYGIGGKQMATLMLKPLVSDYLEVVTGGGELEFRVEELELRGECCAIGRSIGDLEVRSEDRGHHPGRAARGAPACSTPTRPRIRISSRRQDDRHRHPGSDSQARGADHGSLRRAERASEERKRQ